MRDYTNRCVLGDVRKTIPDLIAAGVRVQTVITSPPYWGLRSYLPDGHSDKPAELGLEATPGAYIANMVEVFQLVRELLAHDGTLWLNMGDSYCSAPNGNHGKGTSTLTAGGRHQEHVPRPHQSFRRDREPVGGTRHRAATALKPKDLVGIPWRLAFALQDAGWWLRQDIIWSKPNPMPESVTDRCTKAHEYLFLLTKSERYYFDQDAILEPVSAGTHARLSQNVQDQIGSERAHAGAKTNGNMKAVGRKLAEPGSGTKNNASFDAAMAVMPEKRNKRSVWTIPTEAFGEAHFATFPQALVEPCILAGSRVGDVVFDPFLGSGTVAQVAQRLGRKWLGCELNPAYVPLQDKRTAQAGMAFA